ncbi:MAG: hypothetical protein H7Z13_01945 [Ferruginibacter sp.]|nr:hypothetical protein [Ferruginibacter sp.]
MIPIVILAAENIAGDNYLAKNCLNGGKTTYNSLKAISGESGIQFPNKAVVYTRVTSPYLIFPDIDWPLLNKKELLIYGKINPILKLIHAIIVTLVVSVKGERGIYKKHRLWFGSKPPVGGNFLKGFKKNSLFSFCLYTCPKTINHAA